MEVGAQVSVTSIILRPSLCAHITPGLRVAPTVTLPPLSSSPQPLLKFLSVHQSRARGLTSTAHL